MGDQQSWMDAKGLISVFEAYLEPLPQMWLQHHTVAANLPTPDASGHPATQHPKSLAPKYRHGHGHPHKHSEGPSPTSERCSGQEVGYILHCQVLARYAFHINMHKLLHIPTIWSRVGSVDSIKLLYMKFAYTSLSMLAYSNVWYILSFL